MTASITIHQDNKILHHAVIDTDGDIDAQIHAIVDYVRPWLQPSSEDDAEASALAAAVTAYRLCLAAETARKIEQERRLAEIRAAMPHLIQEAKDIEAQRRRRAADREQRRKDRYERRKTADQIPYTPTPEDAALMDAAIADDLSNWLMPTPDTPADIQARADLAATRTPYIDEAPARVLPDRDPDEPDGYYDDDDQDSDYIEPRKYLDEMEKFHQKKQPLREAWEQDEDDQYNANAWNDPRTPPSSTYREDWQP